MYQTARPGTEFSTFARESGESSCPKHMHRWFFPVVFTALFFGLFGDFVQDFAVRLRELIGG